MKHGIQHMRLKLLKLEHKRSCLDRGEGAPVRRPYMAINVRVLMGQTCPIPVLYITLLISPNGMGTGPVIRVPYTRKYMGMVRSPSKPTKNFLELVPAATSLYQLVQAQKVGKFTRVKARSKNSQVISENSCQSKGRVIKLILLHSICTKRHK